MDANSLWQAVLQAGPSALGISFLTGFLFSFNPVALASIPVALAYVTKARTPRQSRVFAGMFIAGLVLTHVVLGGAAGLGGQGLEALLGRYWGLVLGPWLILLGLLWPGWIRLPFKGLSFRVTRATGVWGAFALGVPFAVAVCPVCTPAMIVLLGVTAGSGSVVWGAGPCPGPSAHKASVRITTHFFAVAWNNAPQAAVCPGVSSIARH